jgi:prepilin-type N-terminal cleavage/methylation domain-containing protein
MIHNSMNRKLSSHADQRPTSIGFSRRSFTLIELLLVITIISILASTALFALYGATEDARERRTRAQVTKIHQLIMDRWEGYRTRKLPVRIPPGADIGIRSGVRLHALRELMRMELPDRISDITFSPSPIVLTRGDFSYPVQVSPPALWRTYRRRAGLGRQIPSLPWPSQSPMVADLVSSGVWTIQHQGAECLYLIISSIQEGDDSALEFFKESEIGDVDADGHPEILDAWGRPIEFLRWAPGFATLAGRDLQWGIAGMDDDNNGVIDDVTERGAFGSDDESELQSRIADDSPDPFDPLHVDIRWRTPDPDPFALFPLIYSAGPDGVLDIATENPTTTFVYALTEPTRNDPYAFVDSNNRIQAGRPIGGVDGRMDSEDNITNHLLETN